MVRQALLVCQSYVCGALCFPVMTIKMSPWDFPGDPVLRNLPANARHGFDPWSGKIPHATEQVSLCATTAKPSLQGPPAATTEAHVPRACALQEEELPQEACCRPHLPQLEKSPDEATKTQCSKNKQFFKKEKVCRIHILRIKEGIWSLQLPWSSSQANLWSHPFSDLLQQGTWFQHPHSALGPR